MTRVVLFDVMSTLVYDPYLVELPEFFGMTFQELVQNKDRTVWPRFERAEITEQEFLSHYFSERADAIDADALRAHLREAYRFLDGIESLLERLEVAGVEMHAFSNYPVWYSLIEEKLTLSRFMSWSFVSCDTGFRKPDAQAYRHAIDVLDMPSEQLIFVDDRESNVAAARESGMHGIVFSDALSLENSLSDLF